MARFAPLFLSLPLALALSACNGDDTNDMSGGASNGSTTDMCPRGVPTDTTTGSCPATTGTSGTGGNPSGSTSGATAGSTSAATQGSGGSTGQTSGNTTQTTGNTTGGLDCSMGCSAEASFGVEDDQCGHDPFVMIGAMETIEVTTTDSMITLAITSGPMLDAVSGPLNPDGTFTATGTGTVAGMPGISIEWTGTLMGNMLTATLTLGGDGKLPGGCPIVYSVSATL